MVSNAVPHCSLYSAITPLLGQFTCHFTFKKIRYILLNGLQDLIAAPISTTLNIN